MRSTTSTSTSSTGRRGSQPLDYAVHPVDLTGMTVEAVKQFGLSPQGRTPRAKNMFALGLLSWMYGRPTESTIAFLEEALRQGPRHPRRQHHGLPRRLELRRDHRDLRGQVPRSSRRRSKPGTYRNITGNLALAYGLVASGVRSGLSLFLGPYPITPRLRHPARARRSTSRFGVTTFQAEDEIAGMRRGPAARRSRVRSASPRRHGPGIALKSEAIGPGGDDRAAADRHRRPARRALAPACPPRPSRPTCCRRCSAATASAPVPIVAAAVARRLLRDAVLEAVRIAVDLHARP